MSYYKSGFNSFLDRSISSQTIQVQTLEDITLGIGRNELAFDRMQISGSLGDKIQIGGSNVIIDGGNKRIIINDGNVDRIIIGELK